jgi:hypothetical protein
MTSVILQPGKTIFKAVRERKESLEDADAISLKSLEILKHEDELSLLELQDESSAKACSTLPSVVLELRCKSLQLNY